MRFRISSYGRYQIEQRVWKMGRKMLLRLVIMFSLDLWFVYSGRGLFALGYITSKKERKFLPPNLAFQLDAIIQEEAVD